MNVLTLKGLRKAAPPPIPPSGGTAKQLVRSGIGAGAGLLVLSAVSSAVSAARRRREQP